MKKKLLPVGLLMSFPIFLSPILIVNSCRSNLPENDEMTLENFVANIKPTLKTNKENLKAQTLASSIQTEDDVKNWYDNLPQSQNGINVTFQYASSDNTKGVLKIVYLIEKNGNKLTYTKEDNGFKISDKTQDQIDVEDFVKNINPTLKTDKENLKAQTLASSIKTEDDVKNWYDNLPQSQNGINVTFRYASSDDAKGMLTVYYQIQKGSYVTSFYWETSGFQIETPSTSQPSEDQDRIDVEDFISKLTNPVIKENKKSEQATTPAENIRTETEINEWFDGLWSGDAEKGIQVSFSRTETNSNNSSIAKGTLRVYYQIQKGSYTTTSYWETSGFQIETPSTSQPSTGTTKFKITFKRSNGKLLDNYNPVIDFYKDGNTEPFLDDKQIIGPVTEFELPTGTYRCVIVSNIPNGMEVNREFTISEQNPSYDVIFTPKNLQNEPTPENYKYQYNDVLFQTEYTDVNDNKVKLSDNIKNNKVTIIMFFKIDCSNSQAMFEEIDRWKQEAGIKDRFDAWLFSTSDSKDRLKLWSNTWKNFKVFYDENRMVRKHYFDDTKVPRICFIDQEGVLISKVVGKVNNLKNYLLELLN
ncbi:lipoprotein 17-related variable surface protein [Metamycoplasma sualvi]|uniref:lipoprotein 17-related variable surface protein n=1 Tax=Metamycoplasma sualvi TaxID=2125 RepID=UPI0038735582